MVAADNVVEAVAVASPRLATQQGQVVDAAGEGVVVEGGLSGVDALVGILNNSVAQAVDPVAVVARAAVHAIAAGAAVNEVVTLITKEPVVACTTIDEVVTGGTDHLAQDAAAIAVDGVVAAEAKQAIAAAEAVDDVAGSGAEEGISTGGADDGGISDDNGVNFDRLHGVLLK